MSKWGLGYLILLVVSLVLLGIIYKYGYLRQLVKNHTVYAAGWALVDGLLAGFVIKSIWYIVLTFVQV